MLVFGVPYSSTFHWNRNHDEKGRELRQHRRRANPAQAAAVAAVEAQKVIDEKNEVVFTQEEIRTK